MHILDLQRIRPMLDLKTASTMATSIVHAKLDYCNSLFLNIDITQINCLQAIQNALARAVIKTTKHHHVTPVIKKLHWLKIPERIEYKAISLTYNPLQSSQPSYLRQLFTIQPSHSMRSFSALTVLHPSVTSSLKFSRSIHNHSCPTSLEQTPTSIATNIWPILRNHQNLTSCYISTALSFQT